MLFNGKTTHPAMFIQVMDDYAHEEVEGGKHFRERGT